MANSTINFDALEKTISGILNDYAGEVADAVKEVVPQVAKEAVKKLKNESPRGDGKNSGKYAKGWTMTTQKGRLSVSATVYGKKGTYNLAHLLEYGHAIKSGGRVVGNAKAIAHIEPVNDWADKEVEKRIIEKVQNL